MVGSLLIAGGVGIAALWQFKRSEPASIARSKVRPRPGKELVVRHCPNCGHESSQQVIVARPSYVTYLCGECSIPYDAEPEILDGVMTEDGVDLHAHPH
jgi:predicted RNA-binding Zn-ribbon protein involved in translation (DUF1610 family)